MQLDSHKSSMFHWGANRLGGARQRNGALIFAGRVSGVCAPKGPATAVVKIGAAERPGRPGQRQWRLRPGHQRWRWDLSGCRQFGGSLGFRSTS